MGFSKKGLKRKQKGDKQKGPKAKKKEKLGKQIEGRKKHLESKRSAVQQQQGKKRGDKSQIDSVDDLLASLGADDDDESLEENDLVAPRSSGGREKDGDGAESSCSEESSAGAFQDVDGGDDLAPEDLAAALADEDEEGAPSGKKKQSKGSEAQRHEKELQEIKEKDPEFYKFLVEQDKQLLDFRAEELQGQGDQDDGEDVAEDEEDEDFAAVQQGKEQQATGRLLTLDRFKQIEASAKTSFTAFKAALNAFHTAVRSIEGAPEADTADLEDVAQPGDDEGKRSRQKAVAKQRKRAEKERNRSSASLRRKQRSAMTIDNEATFSEILEWSIAEVPALLRHYAGDIAGGKKEKKNRKGKEHGAGTDAEVDGLFDPSRFSRWRRVKVVTNIFWDEVLFLLNHLQAPQMLEFVLRNCSTPEALCWLWPFKHLRKRYLKRCCWLWAHSGAEASQTVRLLAFLFIRNSAAMALQAPRLGAKQQKDTEVPQLEVLMRSVLRSFADLASSGYSWRSLSNFRFMENCILELFRVEDATAYRVGYVCIRQLALILRNACVAASQGASAAHGPAKKGKDQKKSAKAKGNAKTPKSKGGKNKGAQMKQVEALISWPFVRALCLWTKAVSSIPTLKPLAYPLSMIIMGAVKSRLTSLQHFPFVYHGLQCLNRLGQNLEAFVPVSAHLLKALQVLMQAMEKEQKLRKSGKGKNANADRRGADEQDDVVDRRQATVAKAPEVEVLLHFQQGQLGEGLTLEAVGSSLHALFVDHLGLLSRSPSFPEMVAPVLLHLRRHSKHCRSEALRRQLKALQTSVEQSSEAVRRSREQLQEPPPPGKLLVLESNTPLARQRVQLLQRRQAEERQCVEAEQKAEVAPKNYEERKKADRKRKRDDDKKTEEEDGTKKKTKKAKQKKPKASAADTARAEGAASHTDVLEEMAFSDGEES